MTYKSVFSCKYVWRIRTIDVVEVQENLQNKNKAPLDEVNSEITGLAQDRSLDVNGILKLYFLNLQLCPKGSKARAKTTMATPAGTTATSYVFPQRKLRMMTENADA